MKKNLASRAPPSEAKLPRVNTNFAIFIQSLWNLIKLLEYNIGFLLIANLWASTGFLFIIISLKFSTNRYVVDLSRIITHFLFHLKIKLWQKKPLKNLKTYKNFHSGLNLFKNREKRSLLFDFFLEKSIFLGFIRESEGKNKIETERKQLNEF